MTRPRKPKAPATVRGKGTIAQGKGAKAVGRGVLVGRDVHGGIVVGNHEEDRPETSALRTAYLNWLAKEVGSLSLAGIDPAAAKSDADGFSLDAVYTALGTLSTEADEAALRRKSAEGLGERRRFSALEQLNEHPRLVLLGDPGSGKSTFVNFVALCLAGEALDHPHANLNVLRSPLPADDESGEREKPKPQPWKHGPLLPVRVVLRDFATRGLPEGEATAQCLWAFIETTLAQATLADYAPLLRKELLEKGGLLLFDGLDEVPEAGHRRDRLRAVVEDFAAAFAKCRVLVTCRTYAYRGQGWTLRGFKDAELAPFSPGQIRRFVERWYDQVALAGRVGAEEAKGRAELLKRAIFGSDRLRPLAERPLLLTLMASLHAWRGGSLPDKREQLYADAVELLLDRWESHRVTRDGKGNVVLMQPSLAQFLAVGKDDVRKVIEELAYEVHSQGALERTADVPEKELLGRLVRLGRKDVNPVELVSYLSDRAGLLVQRAEGVYTFPHRTFQEYLAACALTGSDFPDTVAELGRTDPQRWREVVLLAGAKAARGAGSTAWSLAETLCPSEVSGCEEGVQDVWGAHLAGQVLVECADLNKVSKVHQAKLERIRSWHVQLLRSKVLPARERALAGRTLAVLGDPRFDPERWFLPKDGLLGFAEVPGGPFLMGSDKEKDSRAWDDELPQHEMELPRYFIGRYPVTVAQFGTFVASAGYDAHPATREGLSNEPVSGVTWHDALAYCRWLEARLKELGDPRLTGAVTLPSEAEWEKAARGTDGRVYPWEGGADPEKASYVETGLGGPSAVGCFPLGASRYGCEEVSGNVWEWTRSVYGKYPYPKPGGGRSRRENLEASSEALRVLRGGSFIDLSRFVRCAARYWNVPTSRFRNFGFRVVLLPFSSGL